MKIKFLNILMAALVLISCNEELTREVTLNDEAAFKSFYFVGDFNQDAANNEEEAGVEQRIEGEIDHQTKTIFVQFPIGGINLKNLTASFETSFGAFAYVDGRVQESNITANDFSEPLIYTVESESGHKVNYTVEVINGLNNQTDVKYMYFKVDALDDKTGLPSEDSVAMEISSVNGTLIGSVRYEVDRTKMTPCFKISPRAKMFIGTKEQISGEQILDFTNPVAYTVTAEDGTSQSYVATIVRLEPADENTLTKLSFTKANNPTLVSTINAVIDEQAKIIEVTVPEDLDLTKAVATLEASPKATFKLGDKVISSDVAANFSGATKLSVVAQNTAKVNEYDLKIRVMAMGTYNIDMTKSIGMTVTEPSPGNYTIVPSSASAKFETSPIDYVNPGKVLSFIYKSSQAAKLKITLKGAGTLSGAVSELYDLAATSSEKEYSFDLSIMQRLFKWGAAAGTSFVVEVKDASGATINLRALKVRGYTDEEQVAAEKVYFLNYTDNFTNLASFRNLTTCYAPDQLTYELTYTGNFDRTQAGILAQLERDLTEDFSVLEYEFFVEGDASMYQTLFTVFKFNSNVDAAWSMAWNWNKGATIGGSYGQWTLKTLNMDDPSESWPQQDGHAGNIPYYFSLAPHFGVKPQMFLSLGLLDGTPPANKTVKIRGLRVRKP